MTATTLAETARSRHDRLVDLRLVARLYVDLCRTNVSLCRPEGPADLDLLWTGSAVRNWFG